MPGRSLMLPSWPLGRGIRPTGISTSRACTGSSSGAAVTQSKKSARQDVFQSVAEEWIALQTNQLQPATLVRFRDRLTNCVYPCVGSRPIARIEALDLLAGLRRVESRGIHETGRRTRADCGRDCETKSNRKTRQVKPSAFAHWVAANQIPDHVSLSVTRCSLGYFGREMPCVSLE